MIAGNLVFREYVKIVHITPKKQHIRLIICCFLYVEILLKELADQVKTINLMSRIILQKLHFYLESRLSSEFHNDPKLTLRKDTIPFTIIFDKSF